MRRTAGLSLGLAGLLLGLGPAIADEPVRNLALPGDAPGPQMGEDAYALKLRAYNEEIALKLLTTPDVALHNFVGLAPEVPKKAVVLHFFSVDHKRSVKDLPILQKVYKKYRDDGLMVLSISIDPDSPEQVYAAMDDARVSFPVLKDRFGIVSRRYGVRQLPVLYVLDAQGRVTSVREGYVDDINDVLDAEVSLLLDD